MPKGRFLPATTAVLAMAVLGAAGFALAGGIAASGKSYLLTAKLNALQEVPTAKGVRSGASGLFTATLAISGTRGKLAWRLIFKNLSGPAIAAHVHTGAPGKPGPVVIPLCGPCRSGAHGVFSGAVGGRSALLAAILHGRTYVNVHTKKNPNGEIRGQVEVTGTTTSSVTSSGTTSTTAPYTSTY